MKKHNETATASHEAKGQITRPDRELIDRWWRTILKTVPPAEGQEVSIRTFPVRGAPKIDPMPYETDADLVAIVDQTMDRAEWAVRQKEEKGEVWVVAPVPQVFKKGTNKADRGNLVAAGVIYAELDARPQDARDAIQTKVGVPSMTVVSGGQWTAPDGTAEDKLHLYWQLDPPVTDKADVGRLWSCMERLKVLADAGDMSPQPVHPMRAAGTVHTKTDAFRLSRILDGTAGGTITLDQLEDALAGVVVPSGTANQPVHAPQNKPRLALAKTIEEILSGGELHGNLVPLSASLIARGLAADEVEDVLKTVVAHSPRALSEPLRVKEALTREIPAAVKSARKKFVAEEFSVRSGGQRLWSPLVPHRAGRIPLDVLPPMVRDWAQARAGQIGVDVNGLVGAMLGAASAAIDGRTVLELAPGYEVPAWLWIMIVGDVSAKKTPALKAATSKLVLMTNENAKAHAREVAQWDEDNDGVAKNKLTPFPNWKTRYTTSDTTIEALAQLLSRQDCGIGIIVDEISGLLDSFGSYKASGANKDVAAFLELWDGNPKTVDRATGGRKGGARTISIDLWGGAVVGGIQPGKLRNLNHAIVRNGLLERFLPVMMGPAMAGEHVTHAGAKDWDNILEYLTRCWPQSVTMDIDAMMAFQDFSAELMGLQKMPFSDGVLGAFGKLQGITGRLALTLHFLDHAAAGVAGEEQGPVGPLPGEVMDRAIRLVRVWIVPSVLSFWERMSVGANGGLVQNIARYILRNQQESYTVRDFKRNGTDMKHLDAETIERALGQFEAGGWLMRAGDTRKGTASWDSNPQIWTDFKADAEQAVADAEESRKNWSEWSQASK